MTAEVLPRETADEEAQPHWVSRAAFPLLVLIFAANQALLATAVYHGRWWLAVPLMLTCSHLMHGFLIGFHEATHGLLRNHRGLNEADGLILGALSFMSFSLYRAAHQTHHAFLGTERDEELWPFVHPAAPRWQRRLAAFLELNAGLVYTPTLFLRTFLRTSSPIRAARVRRRIWLEFIGMAILWTGVLAATAYFHTWKYFVCLYLIPAVIAGNLQSWRKYIEHVGLTGSTIRSATRSIIPQGRLGHFFAVSLLHEPYHGVHHQQPGLPHPELPQNATALRPEAPDECAPFPSYRHALLHLLGELKDPRVGAQWRQPRAPQGAESVSAPP